MTSSDDRTNDRFKLPGSSLDEVFKVVQGYSSLAKKAPLVEVSNSTGLHSTVVSRNVGFLLSLGVLEGGRDKRTTEIGQKLGLALMHDVSDEVEALLADIVSNNDFLKNILAAVRIRKGMDDSSLRAHIAYSAGQSKTGATSTGTGAIVELLKRAGQLKAEDGKLVVATPTVRGPSTVVTPDPQLGGSTETIGSVTQTVESAAPFSISINIDIRCDPSDLDTLGEKLRRVVEDFSRNAAGDSSEE